MGIGSAAAFPPAYGSSARLRLCQRLPFLHGNLAQWSQWRRENQFSLFPPSLSSPHPFLLASLPPSSLPGLAARLSVRPSVPGLRAWAARRAPRRGRRPETVGMGSARDLRGHGGRPGSCGERLPALTLCPPRPRPDVFLPKGNFLLRLTPPQHGFPRQEGSVLVTWAACFL